MKDRPNILLYFTDQQRADTCGCYGQTLPITPNLDELAAHGTRFEWAFTPQPVCGPFRALLQTGLYPTQTGCFKNDIMLPHNVKTLANYLEEAGYETAYAGKWHLASERSHEEHPVANYTITAIPQEYRGGYNGFWRAADVLEFTSHGYDGYVFDENNQRIDFHGYRADCITDLALDFFTVRDTNKPFFMTISHIEPHHQNDRNHYEGPAGSKEKFSNFHVPPDLAGLPGDYETEYPDYLGACSALDENLGKVIRTLKDKGLYEDTVIIFVSDHGSHFRTRNHDSHLNGYDDYKRSCHDACLRVPLVISGGIFCDGGVIHDLVSTASLPKTILALAGIDIGSEMIGENLSDILCSPKKTRKNEVFVQISESRVGRCIRTPEYKYAVFAPGINGNSAASAERYADDFLYDLRKDPIERINLIGDPAYDVVKHKLREQLLSWIWQEEHVKPIITDEYV